LILLITYCYYAILPEMEDKPTNSTDSTKTPSIRTDPICDERTENK